MAASAGSSTMDIVGTKSQNISSDSTQLSYVGTWRSDFDPGYYQAYSNASNAEVTFSFIGVAASYIAEKKADRGICQLTLDGITSYTLDLYNDSNYTQGAQAVWTSDTLVYGHHSVSISQLGPDARFGYYPYLVTETWVEIVPTNVPAYTQTQIVPSSSATSEMPRHSSGPDTAAIAGGAVGGVVACALLGFLLYLWRREKKRQRRSEGLGPVQKVKKADGKMAIEDEPDSSSGGGHGPYGSEYGPHGYGAPPPGGYGDPYAPYPGYPGGYGYAGPPPFSTFSSAGTPAWAPYPYPMPSPPPAQPQPHLLPPNSAGSTDSQQPSRDSPSQPRSAGPGSAGPSPSSPGFAPTSRGSYYDSAYHSGGASDGGGGSAYPYHVQGAGNSTHAYAVPEI
ncbi:hypothetical protein JCM11641_008219 [Rhodosporidiobolus odoratus]